MKIIINGKPEELENSTKTLSDLLVHFDLINKRIAIEVNGEIVSRSLFEKKKISPNDQIEIIQAVGGG